MGLTYYQTVEIRRPDKFSQEFEVSNSPVAPEGVSGIRKENGAVIYWDEYKIEMIESDGTVYTWYSRPTIADCIQSRENGNRFEFKPDGSVLTRYGGITYFWSAPLIAKPEEGIVIRVRETCELSDRFRSLSCE